MPIDFRIVAATNRDLSQAVERGHFRLDLLYRLNVFTIHIPPLRERRTDIPLLAHYFLAKSAREMNRPASRFSAPAMKLLTGYAWPGNVRELENVVERAVVLQRGEEIQATDLPLTSPSEPPSLPKENGLSPGSELSLEGVEKRHIQNVLKEMDGNVSQAARALGIDRVTLYNKIRKYRLRDTEEHEAIPETDKT
jgi:DNA-binding NtrC family response regulator